MLAGVAGLGTAGPGWAWLARLGRDWRGEAWQGTAGMAWRGTARQGAAGLARHGGARHGGARHGGAGKSTPTPKETAVLNDLARTLFTVAYFGALGYGVADLITVGHRRKAAR